MDETITIVPAYPPPPYLLTLLPPSIAPDPYTYLTVLLSAPTSHLVLCPPIRLPRSLFDRASILPEIKGTVLNISFSEDLLCIGLHPSTKHALTRAYESFLQSYPNRCVPGEIKESWRARFWRNMDWVQWVVPAELLCWIDPVQGSCDLSWEPVLRGVSYELPRGVPEMLNSVGPKIKRLFAPTLEEERSIWEIPYQIGENLKSRFRADEEDDVEARDDHHHPIPLEESSIGADGMWETITVRPPLTTVVEAGVNAKMLETHTTIPKRKRKRKRAPSFEDHLDVDECMIVETEGGGKSATRRIPRTEIDAGNARLLITSEGRAYVETAPQPIRRRPLPAPPPLPPPSESQLPIHSPTSQLQPQPPQPQSFREPGSYPTPPADHTLLQPQPDTDRPFEPVSHNIDRPSPLNLPSPLLSGEDYECKDTENNNPNNPNNNNTNKPVAVS
jgi:hypothetical protein